MQVAKSLPQFDVVVTGQPSTHSQIPKTAGRECISSFGSIPGDEFPAAVYRTVVFAFVWMMLVAWRAFGGTAGTDLDLAMATLLSMVFLGIPISLRWTARNRLKRTNQDSKQFLKSRVDIATGTISGTEAWLEVILIPIALALACTLIGGVFALMS
jgi:hypothetical protein